MKSLKNRKVNINKAKAKSLKSTGKRQGGKNPKNKKSRTLKNRMDEMDRHYAKKPMSPAEYKAKLEKEAIRLAQRQEFYNPLENPSNLNREPFWNAADYSKYITKAQQKRNEKLEEWGRRTGMSGCSLMSNNN